MKIIKILKNLFSRNIKSTQGKPNTISFNIH